MKNRAVPGKNQRHLLFRFRAGPCLRPPAETTVQGRRNRSGGPAENFWLLEAVPRRIVGAEALGLAVGDHDPDHVSNGMGYRHGDSHAGFRKVNAGLADTGQQGFVIHIGTVVRCQRLTEGVVILNGCLLYTSRCV